MEVHTRWYSLFYILLLDAKLTWSDCCVVFRRKIPCIRQPRQHLKIPHMLVEDLAEPISELWTPSFERGSLPKWGATTEREFWHKKVNRFLHFNRKKYLENPRPWSVLLVERCSKLNIFHSLTAAHLSPKLCRGGWIAESVLPVKYFFQMYAWYICSYFLVFISVNLDRRSHCCSLSMMFFFVFRLAVSCRYFIVWLFLKLCCTSSATSKTYFNLTPKVIRFVGVTIKL